MEAIPIGTTVGVSNYIWIVAALAVVLVLLYKRGLVGNTLMNMLTMAAVISVLWFVWRTLPENPGGGEVFLWSMIAVACAWAVKWFLKGSLLRD